LCQKIFEFYKEITGKNFTQIYDRDFDIGECIVKIIEYYIDAYQNKEKIKIKIFEKIFICPGDEDYPDVEPQNPPPPGNDPEHQIVLPPRDV
jgi:hypothetical protein